VNIEDELRIVEFKLILAEMAEDYIRRQLAGAAREQGRRLPKQTATLLRTGAMAAVARLRPDDLCLFAQSDDWSKSVAQAIECGAWGRLIHETVRLAFVPETA
jgi:hypothetical protein